MSRYTVYHCHTMYSLLDSATGYRDYIDRAADEGMTAIAFTEHGNVFNWVSKKQYAESRGLKYMHGCEVYLTERMYWHGENGTGEPQKRRDNYHTVLIARNGDGVKELNELISRSYDEDHFYYRPRLTFDEFFHISKNIIKISACIASPLNRMDSRKDPKLYERLVRNYDFLEIQPHDFREQRDYNLQLAELSERYRIPLTAGTDTHSIDQYRAECRKMLQSAKGIEFGTEDQFDLTFKTYDELVEMFEKQGILPPDLYLEAIENTNLLADMVEPFELDTSIKYPPLYGERDSEVLTEVVDREFADKIRTGAIRQDQIEPFREAIAEERAAFKKLNMDGFMLFMSELVTWCRQNGIAVGPGRGSVGGSRVAYVTNITDVNPETWGTSFSRFCNPDRLTQADIDTDFAPDQREQVYQYIIDRFGPEHTAYILSFGTIKEQGYIDEVCRGLSQQWQKAHRDKPGRGNDPYTVDTARRIKKEYASDPEACKAAHPDIFKYHDGLLGCVISQGIHPAGIAVSPFNVRETYGTLQSGGKQVLQLDMADTHSVGESKFDILSLDYMAVLRDAYRLLGKDQIPRSYEINWDDPAVWQDMVTSPHCIFQFSSPLAFKMLKEYQPKNLVDMAMVTAALRPGGESVRDDFISRKPHKNPSELIDRILSRNNGYLLFQEDVMSFLQQVCGFTGPESDEARRAIAGKNEEKLRSIVPHIVEGYCASSDHLREQAEREVREFIQIIQDASRYMFNYSHAIAYCMVGYMCAYLRLYHPYEFITACLNNADNDRDKLAMGSELATLKGIRIVNAKFGLSGAQYEFDKELKVISKGIASIKYMNRQVAEELRTLAHSDPPDDFMDLLVRMKQETSLDTRQREILVRLGYFADYGNARELMAMIQFFGFFRSGEKKMVRKSDLSEEVTAWLAPYMTDLTRSGAHGRSWIIFDMPGLLRACGQLVRQKHLKDYSLQELAVYQKEYLGYVDVTTGLEKDRRKLLVQELRGMKSKTDGRIWGYSIETRSIGSGKVAKLTVQASLYRQKPFDRGDIIYARSLSKNRSGFWYLNAYEIITGE